MMRNHGFVALSFVSILLVGCARQSTPTLPAQRIALPSSETSTPQTTTTATNPTSSAPAQPTPGNSEPSTSTSATSDGIHKIQHVVIIMQENRSFDSYFGTYPGADGIPMKDGAPGVCATDPISKKCVKPYHDPNDRNYGGPHGAVDAARDIDSGKMDGFVSQALVGLRAVCTNSFDPVCTAASRHVDVMGYHDAREIPNYWSYAQHFVLQDHMFEPNASWSLPEHLFMVSAWSAKCSNADPMSCHNELQNPDSFLGRPVRNGLFERPNYAWTDLTYLLHKAT